MLIKRFRKLRLVAFLTLTTVAPSLSTLLLRAQAYAYTTSQTEIRAFINHLVAPLSFKHYSARLQNCYLHTYERTKKTLLIIAPGRQAAESTMTDVGKNGHPPPSPPHPPRRPRAPTITINTSAVSPPSSKVKSDSFIIPELQD